MHRVDQAQEMEAQRLEAVAAHVLLELYQLDPTGFAYRIERIKQMAAERISETQVKAC